jgi:predicted nuclease of predicted toxin-antitoxin system
MKILVDENIPRATVTALRELGHDIRDIRGSADQGLADDALWDIDVRERRLLITTDRVSPSIDPSATTAS